MKISILVAASLATCSAAAAAAAPLYVKQVCDPLARSAAAFHDCYAGNLAAANRALDETYERLLAQRIFYVASRNALIESERAWIVHKDRECAYEYGRGPYNEDHWLAHAGCEIRVTELRIRELRDRPSCTGGDSVCTPHMR